MATETKHTTDLVIERLFDAPREQVWKAWTEEEQVKKWWGPKGYTAPVSTIDLRVGGRYVSCMRGPGLDGNVRDFWSTGSYKEIVPLRKIVCTDSFADEKGDVVPATHYGMSGDFPLEMLITVTFEEREGKTEMVLRHQGIPEGVMRDLTRQGWSESFDKLDASLADRQALRKAA